jgi:molybdopterin converting factor subunit 1
MRTYHVRLFARAKDIAGTESVAVDVPEGSSVGELRRRLAELYPALAGLLERSALAVDHEFVEDTRPLLRTAEIALLPPVSGG